MVEPYSPLRYPGGKACLAGFLAKVLQLNPMQFPVFVEPYCGGAGAALTLLMNGVVPDIMLNDRDYRVYSFWKCARDHTEKFIQRIRDVPLSVKEWHVQKAIFEKNRKSSQFDLGFAAFYLNRCNRSGIMASAGPIGGYGQTGNYKIDVRFVREKLAERIRLFGVYGSKIQLFNQDAMKFLGGSVSRIAQTRPTLVYLDPPYYKRGPELYLNSLTHNDHAALASYLKEPRPFRWIMSYDNCSEIESLYGDLIRARFGLAYSAQTKRQGREFLIAPSDLVLPNLVEILKAAS